MSIVTPIPQNTVIKVYAGIPWDDTLRDVRLFDTSAQRDIYFNGKLKEYGKNVPSYLWVSQLRLKDITTTSWNATI